MPDRPIAFSIVLPTFNRSRLLSRAIDSVLRQDCRNWELIVVNDGSTDKTREVMRSYADDRITYIEHQTNLGMNAALNTGFQRARGKYVAKLDDDDELANFAIGTALSAWKKLGDSKIKLLFFDSINAETGAFSGIHFESNMRLTYRSLLSQKLRGDYWVVVDRGVLPHSRILDENTWGAMGFLWLRILRDFDGHYFPQPLYRAYRDHGMNRLSNFAPTKANWERYERTTLQLLKEFGKDVESICPGVHSRQISSLAFYQTMTGKFRVARSNLLLSIRKHPSIYTLGLLALTLLGNEKMIFFMYRHAFESRLSRN